MDVVINQIHGFLFAFSQTFPDSLVGTVFKQNFVYTLIFFFLLVDFGLSIKAVSDSGWIFLVFYHVDLREFLSLNILSPSFIDVLPCLRRVLRLGSTCILKSRSVDSTIPLIGLCCILPQPCLPRENAFHIHLVEAEHKRKGKSLQKGQSTVLL